LSESRRDPALFSKELSEPPAAWRSLDIETLANFFSNPAKFLIQRRLGVFLEDMKMLVDEKENFKLEGLEKYLVAQALVQRRMGGLDLEEQAPVFKAKGILPYGNVGVYEFKRLTPDVEYYVRRLDDWINEKEPVTMDWRDTVAGFTLFGKIPNIYGSRMIHYRYVKKNPKDMLRLWIYHLAGCCSETQPDVVESTFVFRDTALVYRFAENSRNILARLLEMFWRGLQRPLPFFPFTSHRYAEQRIGRSKTREEAKHMAASQWVSSHARGEFEDPYISLCFSESDGLNRSFEVLAEEIFTPILAHSRVV
jgi:exodeoxyribonuclease V gamma subunit